MILLDFKVFVWTTPPRPHDGFSQLIFEAVRSGFDGRVAVDDVSFVERKCAVPRVCSFEDQRCGFTFSGPWYHRNGQSTTMVGPGTDHTLETPMGEGKSIREEVYMIVYKEERSKVSFPCHVGCTGFYMMASTAANILPAGKAAALVSPVHPGNTKTACVNFWYNMGGETPGETSFRANT